MQLQNVSNTFEFLREGALTRNVFDFLKYGSSQCAPCSTRMRQYCSTTKLESGCSEM